jgi:type I site-specific restriction-modification system R (restriction) subunit
MDAPNESVVEDAALTWFVELGYDIAHGPHLAPGEPASERDSFADVILKGRLRHAIQRLNSGVPEEARDEAFRKLLGIATPLKLRGPICRSPMRQEAVLVQLGPYAFSFGRPTRERLWFSSPRS